MAIINSMAIGKARKSAGNITFATVKGRTVAREKPAYVRNPQTQAQVAQREKMAKVVAVWRSFASRLSKVFTVIPGYGSAYNQFVKMNIDKASGITINPMTGKVTVSAGLALGNGKYSDLAVALYEPTTNVFKPIVYDSQLLGEIKVGDIFGLLSIDKNTGAVDVQEVVCHETEVSAWRSGNIGQFENGCTVDQLHTVYYFSPSRNISNSPVLKPYVEI